MSQRDLNLFTQSEDPTPPAELHVLFTIKDKLNDM